MHHRKRTLAWAAGAAAIIAAAAAVPALATNPHGAARGNSANAQEHVTICHATSPDTAANGYVEISPSASGVYHGHLRQHDADIIPPFTYDGATYSENWDASGQAIYADGCAVPAPTTAAASHAASHGKSSAHAHGAGHAHGAAHANGSAQGGTHGNSANAHEHVTICHATPPDTAANGYVVISPSASGVYHGHLRQHAADIIPPFVYSGVTYSANWDATGQAIFANGCVVPASSSTAATTAASRQAARKVVAAAAFTAQVRAAAKTILAALQPASAKRSGGVLGARKTLKRVSSRSRPARAATAAASFTG